MTSPAPIAWIVPAGTKIDVARRHGLPRDKSEIEPSSTAHAIAAASVAGSGRGRPWLRSRAQDVPGFGLAVRQSNRMRVSIVGMDLDGQRLAREQQLEQERSFAPPAPGRSYQISPIASPSWRHAPRAQIDDTPGLGRACARACSIAINPYLFSADNAFRTWRSRQVRKPSVLFWSDANRDEITMSD